MGNVQKKKKCGKKKLYILLLICCLVVVIGVVGLILWLGRQDTAPEPGNPQTPVQNPIQINPDNQNMALPVAPEDVKEEAISGFRDQELVPLGELSNGLTLSRVGSYTGTFVEDGSNQEITDVLAVLITNNGDKFVELAEVYLLGADGAAQFQLTSLPVGHSVLVMEKNARLYNEGLSFKQAVVQTYSAPDKEFSLYPETFSIKAADGVVNLIHQGKRDLTGPVAIYYKNVQDGIYIGGITYSETQPNGVKVGGILQFMPKYYTVAGSELVFIRHGA